MMRYMISLLLITGIFSSCQTIKKNDKRKDQDKTPLPVDDFDETGDEVTGPVPDAEDNKPDVIVISLEEKDGFPEFNVVYSYSAAPSFEVTFKSGMTDEELAALEDKPIAYSFHNGATADTVSPWIETTKDNMRNGKITVTDKSVLKNILTELEFTDIVFGVKVDNAWEPRFVLQIGSYCDSFPSKWTNQTSSSKPCSEIEPEDLPPTLTSSH